VPRFFFFLRQILTRRRSRIRRIWSLQSSCRVPVLLAALFYLIQISTISWRRFLILNGSSNDISSTNMVSDLNHDTVTSFNVASFLYLFFSMHIAGIRVGSFKCTFERPGVRCWGENRLFGFLSRGICFHGGVSTKLRRKCDGNRLLLGLSI
jgi:hypothetical protein